MKRLAKAILARTKVRKALFIFQIPFSYVIIKISRIFDKNWYELQCNSIDDEKIRKVGPLIHYLVLGRRKGYSPNSLFLPEYFDSRNWHRSIIDPLTRYIIDRKNWNLPTSFAFRGDEAKPGRASLLNFYTNPHKNQNMLAEEFRGDWGDTYKKLMNFAKTYSSQESIRDQSRPVNKFDFGREEKTIDEFLNHKEDQLVSIITPVWNRPDLVVDAIKSVQAQTYKNWEMIITDDGSTDNTVEIIKKFAKKDKRIKILEPGHQGVSGARNSSIKEATGEWIAFLDSDNVWTPNFLSSMVGSLNKTKQRAAYSAIRMDNNGQIRYRTTEYNPEILKTGNFIDLNSIVVDRKIIDKIGGFDTELRRMVDYDLVIKISREVDFVYVPVVGVLYSDHEDQSRITTTEPVSWDGVVKANNFLDLDSKKPNLDLSIIIPVRNDLRTFVRLTKSIERDMSSWDFKYEIIVADSASNPSVGAGAKQWSDIVGATYIRLPFSHDSTLGANFAAMHSSGEKIVFLDQRVEFDRGAISELYGVSKNTSGLISLLGVDLYRSVYSAGDFLADLGLTHFLNGHPIEDAHKLGKVFEVESVVDGAVIIGRSDFAKLRGFNPLLSQGFAMQDLSLRLRYDLLGEVNVFTGSSVTIYDQKRGLNTDSEKIFKDIWLADRKLKNKPKVANLYSKLKFDVADWSEDGGLYVRPTLKKKKNHPKRWSIKISAPADSRRFEWGDLYYAESVRKELHSLGYDAHINYHENHLTKTSYLDDVLLDIRGLDEVKPQQGIKNIMWLISHPEKVNLDSIRGFDAVFSASKKWISEHEHQTKTPIHYLPQATDSEIFYRRKNTNSKYKDRIIFVGNSRKIMRRSVLMAIEAGIDFDIYGGGWHGLVDEKYIKGEFIPNDKLPEAYGSAKLVLNDHWDDMRDYGIISNRIFDVLASGGVVLTDYVEGIEEVKGDVFWYKNKEEFIDAVQKIEKIKPKSRKQSASYYFKDRVPNLLIDLNKEK